MTRFVVSDCAVFIVDMTGPMVAETGTRGSITTCFFASNCGRAITSV